MQKVNGCVFNATSGFGHDIAVRLDELGFTVFAGCLHPGGHGAKKLKSSSSNNLHIVPVDVGNDDSVLKAHQYVVENLPPNGMYHFHSGFGNDLQYLWVFLKLMIDFPGHEIQHFQICFEYPDIIKTPLSVGTALSLAKAFKIQWNNIPTFQSGFPVTEHVLVKISWALCYFFHSHNVKNCKWVWSGNTTITNFRQPHGTARKSHSTITRHQEDKLSKATSSLFSIKMIAILKWTYSSVQQNIEQLQTPTMGVTINKKSTTTEPPPWKGQQPTPPGGGA